MPIHRPEYFEHGVYHIYNRGVAKLPMFLNADDYHDFQDILRYLIKGFPQQKDANLPKSKADLPVTYKADHMSNGLFRPLLDLIAYCLMPNHFHLLIQVKQPTGKIQKSDGRFASFCSIPEFLRRACNTYSHKFNRLHGREGALFQGRFKIKHIPSDPDVLQVARYIHLNPVVSSLVTKPERWLFCDYHEYLISGSMRTFQITNPGLILSYFGGNPERYRAFIQETLSEREAKTIAKYIIDGDEEQA